MTINRRDFIRNTVGVFAACMLPQRLLAANGDLILGGGKYQLSDTKQIYNILSIIDLQANNPQTYDMEFLPHGIHRSPVRPNVLAIFEKKGPGAVEFDLQTRKVLRPIPQLKNRYFYGHGSYTIDGLHLLSTESFLDSLDGVITIRDSKTLKHIGDFPSYGKEPHECKLIDSGKTLVVTNGGGGIKGDAPSVAYIDINSQQLIEKVTLDNSRLNTGHFAVSDNGSLMIVSAPRAGLGQKHLGGVSMRSRGKKIITASIPLEIVNNMFGEALSVCIHNELGIAAVTHPNGNMVTFWSIQKRQFISSINLFNPRGVELSQDEKYFLVSAGEKGSLMRIPVNTLKTESTAAIEHSFLSGSHIYNFSRKTTEILAPGPFA